MKRNEKRAISTWKQILSLLIMTMILLGSTMLPAYAGSKKTKKESVTTMESKSDEKAAAAKTVTPKEVKISGSGFVAKGKSITLTAKVMPSGASQDVTWSSSNKKIATVSNKGVVKGVKAGKVTITATSKAKKSVKAKFTVTVKAKPVTSVSIKGAVKEMKVSEEITLKATASPKSAAQTITWKTSNKKIATVDQNGVVKAVGKGKVNITATATDGSKKKKTVSIKVVKSTEENITINEKGIVTACKVPENGEVVIPETVNGITVKGLTAGLFKGNKDLKILTIQAKIKEIPESLCENCTSLQKVVLPAVETIRKRAFYGTTSLSYSNIIQN